MKRVTEYTRSHGGMLAVLKNSNRYSAIERLTTIEDILGDNYDLDRLRELVEADRDGRCFIASIKIGERVFLRNDKKEIIGCRVQGISLPVHGKNLIIHLGGYPAEYLWADREGIDWWKTREAAEAALKGENNG